MCQQGERWAWEAGSAHDGTWRQEVTQPFVLRQPLHSLTKAASRPDKAWMPAFWLLHKAHG